MRRIFCIDDEIKDNVEFGEQNLDCQPTVDPDQILWNNIGFSIQEQNARNIIAFIVQILTAIVSVVITFQIANLKKKVPEPPDCGPEVHTPEHAYLE